MGIYLLSMSIRINFTNDSLISILESLLSSRGKFLISSFSFLFLWRSFLKLYTQTQYTKDHTSYILSKGLDTQGPEGNSGLGLRSCEERGVEDSCGDPFTPMCRPQSHSSCEGKRCWVHTIFHWNTIDFLIDIVMIGWGSLLLGFISNPTPPLIPIDWSTWGEKWRVKSFPSQDKVTRDLHTEDEKDKVLLTRYISKGK